MPSMYEIYDHHADRYDALISHEDFQGNLHAVLSDLIPSGAVVAESGIGTGRVTRSYIDRATTVFGFDRSAHMLKRAATNLSRWSDRLQLQTAKHTALPLSSGVADVFVEGWAFGHPAVDRPEETLLVASELVGEAQRVTRAGGSIVLIETLGTNTSEPAAPLAVLDRFYDTLEERHGFARTVVRTDYHFDSLEQAEGLMGFFFGQAMAGVVRKQHQSQSAESVDEVESQKVRGSSSGGVTIPEFTGVWVRR